MAHFDPVTARQPEPESEHLVARRTRLGLALFASYLVLYGGFVLLNAFDPSLMEQTPWAGVNLAVLYGLGLIAAAFLLALLYDGLCRTAAARRPPDGEAGP